MTCTTKYITDMHTIIIPLEKSNACLYTTHTKQLVKVQCEKDKIFENIINKTEEIQTRQQCKFIIDEITL